MAKPEIDNTEDINIKKSPLKTIPTSDQVDYLKGQVIPSSRLFFKLECKEWSEFIQFLEPVHLVDIAGKSPTMPISVDHKLDCTFTALAGLSYPTLLVYRWEETDSASLEKLKGYIQFLKDCGHVVIHGKLSFANKKGKGE